MMNVLVITEENKKIVKCIAQTKMGKLILARDKLIKNNIFLTGKESQEFNEIQGELNFIGELLKTLDEA